MQNELLFIFKTTDMRRLVDAGTDLIVVRTSLESVVLNDGTKAGAVRVSADAVNKGNPTPAATANGCPCPPCSPDDDGDGE